MINCAIDVSHHQGEIDWSVLPSAIKCVMIKATQGSNHVDDHFNAISPELSMRVSW
jgi:GH25 family lysozyme M1 (1,4-beta-N-acetylmuramidase)